MYQLKDGVYFVSGFLKGALLDTNTHNVYSVNQAACQIITYKASHESYWQRLCELELAEVTEHPCLKSVETENKTQSPQFAWFEVVSARCNERCIHCYASAGSSNKLPAALTHIQWIHTISDAYTLGFRNCQFIGGEPLLYRRGHKNILDLITHSRAVGFTRVEVFTNGLLLPNFIKTFADLGIDIAISLYSDNPQIHDKITGTSGSYERTLRAIETALKFRLNIRVETILMRENQETAESTQRFVEQVTGRQNRIDVVRPTGRGTDKYIQADTAYLVRYGLQTTPDFQVDKTSLQHNASGNSCLQGKLAITESGSVFPCIFARQVALGSIMKNSLQEIITNSITKDFWQLTKDSVLVCRDCEYRYVCGDCRALALTQSGCIEAPYPRCTYNPYSGNWGDGVWTMQNNTPVYVTL